jgi:hypothetical protein
MPATVNVAAIRQLLEPQRGPPTSSGRRRNRRRHRSSSSQQCQDDAFATLDIALDRLAEGTVELDAVLAAARAGRSLN